MKGFYCGVAVLAAFSHLVSASFPKVGKQPSIPICFLEYLSRLGGVSDWLPQCYGLHWHAQQCTASGDCWCVDMNSGRSTSVAHHLLGEVDCFETKQCGPDQVFKTCPTECALQCSDLDTITECPAGCKPPRCECPGGFLLHNGACVPSFSCSSLACNTSLNERMSHCPTTSCDVTCDGLECDDSPRGGCHPRCACAPGHVRNRDNVCVDPGQCLTSPVFARLLSVRASGSSSPCQLKKSLLCDEDGKFATTQCDDDACFCADPRTGIPLHGTRAPIKDFDHDCATLTSCPAGTVFTRCAECPPTCDDPVPYCDVSATCTPACACAQDHIRLSSTDDTCVKPVDCPASTKTCQFVKSLMDPSAICDKDGRWWPEQCDSRGDCYCVSSDGSRIADVSDEICDVIRECEMTPGMMWSTCAPSCDEMCNRAPFCSDNSSAAERDGCVSRCTCQPGHVLLIEENICVTRDRCPAPAVSECDLELGEIWTDCDMTCEPTCEDPAQRDCKESTGACVPGCACPPGTYRAPDTRECVEFINCPYAAVCNMTLNEEWSDCAHQCDPTCEDRYPRCYLTRGCAHRCQCPNGHVRDSEGKCIEEEGCYQPQLATDTPTLCQTERKDVVNLIENFGLQDAFVPECDVATGLFATRQCYGFFENECWCVDPATGTSIPGTRTNAFDLDCDAAMTSSGEQSPPEDVAGILSQLPSIRRDSASRDGQQAPPVPESAAQ